MGIAWYRKGQYDKAIEYYEKALASNLTSFGPPHEYVAANWSNLGRAWQAKGQYDKAIEYIEKALSNLESSLGDKHHNTLKVRKYLEEAKIAAGRTSD